MAENTEPMIEVLDAIYREESRRILATLIRLLGDFELAEDALHDAFKAALLQWPGEGVPANPKPGLFQLAATKRLTYCGDKPAWPRHERRSPSGSRSRQLARTRTTRKSRTTGCG